MKLMNFILSLLVGIIISRIFHVDVRVKSKRGFEKEKTIFKLIEGSKDVIYEYEIKPKLKFRYLSPSIEKFLGPGTLEEAFERPNAPFERIHPDDYDNLHKKIKNELDYSEIIVMRWKDDKGNYRWFEEYVTPIYERGELIAVQGIMRNIDEKVELQQDLEYRINHDAMTGIYNRYFFEQNMAKYNKDLDQSVSIVLCDMDGLKCINDNHGHQKGDIYIKTSAKLLQQSFSEDAIVSRIGGDEFAVILLGMNQREVENLCKKLIHNLNEHNINNKDLTIRMSIGYSFAEHSIDHMENLFIKADRNMYKDKNKKTPQNFLDEQGQLIKQFTS
ncbi:sensor domain-containing diguanylate cyclase [Virgibacillus sp. DJP39]|uniref:sensor domain-containing diguanylate cyclase n=1 Tax=Virgibacillus sp. DJP39 TaxID=3409790 RepID=UPI003BB80007